jgi:hypothetical protein
MSPRFQKSNHIRSVLEAYARCENSSLDEIINKIEDAPWLEALAGCLEHAQREIAEDKIRRFCLVLYLMKQFGTKDALKHSVRHPQFPLSRARHANGPETWFLFR